MTTTGEATEPSIDLSELDAFVKAQGPKCTFPKKVASLSPELMATLNAAMASDYGHRIIARWLDTKGVKITEHVIGRHRLGECQCPR